MPSAYLTPEDIARLLDDARPSHKGFMAPCPAHDDTNPSLRIDHGHTCTLLYCHSGCTLDEICEALEIEPAWLFHNYDPNQNGNGRANQEYADFVRGLRPPTRWELRPLETVEDVLREVLKTPSPETWAIVGTRWQDYLKEPWSGLSRRSLWVILNGLCGDLLRPERDAGYDYSMDERRRLYFKMRETWNRYGKT